MERFKLNKTYLSPAVFFDLILILQLIKLYLKCHCAHEKHSCNTVYSTLWYATDPFTTLLHAWNFLHPAIWYHSCVLLEELSARVKSFWKQISGKVDKTNTSFALYVHRCSSLARPEVSCHPALYPHDCQTTSARYSLCTKLNVWPAIYKICSFVQAVKNLFISPMSTSTTSASHNRRVANGRTQHQLGGHHIQLNLNVLFIKSCYRAHYQQEGEWDSSKHEQGRWFTIPTNKCTT